jgi:hypothetical protein
MGLGGVPKDIKPSLFSFFLRRFFRRFFWREQFCI